MDGRVRWVCGWVRSALGGSCIRYFEHLLAPYSSRHFLETTATTAFHEPLLNKQPSRASVGRTHLTTRRSFKSSESPRHGLSGFFLDAWLQKHPAEAPCAVVSAIVYSGRARSSVEVDVQDVCCMMVMIATCDKRQPRLLIAATVKCNCHLISIESYIPSRSISTSNVMSQAFLDPTTPET